MSYYDNFGVDKDKYLLDLYKAGSVISYIAMLMNIVIFAILCRKTLLSPATILMQGLAAADFLTALSYYGLEPVFQSHYHCDIKEDIFLYNECYLPYPYCSMAFHLSISSFTFHTISYTITTCLGIQKVVAILFPIWTKYQLTNKKAVICCVVFFLLSITISIPRHFSAWFKKGNSLNNQCSLHPKGEGILQYSSIYYLMIQTILGTSCCLVMLMSTVFILYKLLTNKFRGRMTEQRRQERRSVIMVIIILVVFLLTEVPKVILYLWWCYKYIAGHFSAKMTRGNEMSSLWLIRRYENAMSWLLVYFTDKVRGSDRYRFIIFKFPMEGINLITIVGCMSNFIIYFVMSTKMRNEIILLLKKMCNYCAYERESNQIKDTTNSRTDEMEMNQINIIRNKHVYEVERNWTHIMGNDCTYSIGINPTQGTRDCTKEIERNQILETGDHCAKELERNQMQGTGDPCAKEIERNQIQGTRDYCTKEIEKNPIQGTGRTTVYIQ
ncbi:unnamed protein product [Mytilus coruscus]|uniref:G-protein coupled receptors family 1 profile domain-containing protein n=1 Tax=Mytilus coruscus TaxID=42192 RepID=A0A6J8BJS8_MYTCO|nr:unnamed protein product [Mytilus coruscus]